MSDTFIYEDIDFETVRSWARRNTLPFETAADLTLINLERKRMMLPGWRISAHVFGSSALPDAEEVELVEDAQAVDGAPAPPMRRVRGAAKRPAPVPGPISSHVPVTEPVAPQAEPEMSLQSLLGYMSAASRKKPGSAQEVLKTRHGFLSARSVPPAMRAQLALEMTVEASKPNVAETTGFIRAPAIDPGMPVEGFLACIRRASRKKPGSAQAVLTVKHKYLSAFDVPPTLRAQLAQEMTDESGEPAAVALAQAVAVEAMICEPEPAIADPAPTAMSLSSFCGRVGAASRRTPGVAQAVMSEHGFQHAGDVPDEMRAQIVQEIAAAASKLAVEQEPASEPAVPVAEMAPVIDFRSILPVTRVEPILFDLRLEDFSPSDHPESIAVQEAARPLNPEKAAPPTFKPVERNLRGVANALFEVLDGVRNGTMSPERIQETYDVSIHITEVLAAEVNIITMAERPELSASRARLLEIVGVAA